MGGKAVRKKVKFFTQHWETEAILGDRGGQLLALVHLLGLKAADRSPELSVCGRADPETSSPGSQVSRTG